ncbi:MAG: aminotransferase class I/II-fold pyridoxal phosphate-dependent enzyme [bacterium]|nr:aminotransferase class I/II-fold pyridoxal phosphate-dependent enzyme [bacterium]
MCNPHNPVGRLRSKEDLHSVATICSENDMAVIANEIHADPGIIQCRQQSDVSVFNRSPDTRPLAVTDAWSPPEVKTQAVSLCDARAVSAIRNTLASPVTPSDSSWHNAVTASLSMPRAAISVKSLESTLMPVS